jgi:hypothetical protein
MPELDGTTIIAIASFAALVVAWLVAPTETVVTVSEREAVPAAA